jgi:RNA polymerase sigma factor (TIGR02999 family)
MSDVTRILDAIGQGDAQAADQLLPLVYQELRRLAAYKMASETPGHTLQPTALVHEAWIKLAGQQDRKWQDKQNFFAAAAEAMRRILVDSARRKRRLRHGGGQVRIEMEEVNLVVENDEQLLAINEALSKLARKDREKAELVKLRYFVGMTIEEAAQVLGISEATAKRHWAYSRAWLCAEMKGEHG